MPLMVHKTCYELSLKEEDSEINDDDYETNFYSDDPEVTEETCHGRLYCN